MIVALKNVMIGYDYYSKYLTGPLCNCYVTSILFVVACVACEICYQYVKRLEDPFIQTDTIITGEEFD
jgi:hypothetical protein